MAEDHGGTADRVDERLDVLDLTGGSIGRGVAAVATAAAVKGDNAERLGQERDEGVGRVPVVQCPAGEDESRRRGRR
jgi:hypothetical protein